MAGAAFFDIYNHKVELTFPLDVSLRLGRSDMNALAVPKGGQADL